VFWLVVYLGTPATPFTLSSTMLDLVQLFTNDANIIVDFYTSNINVAIVVIKGYNINL
jgi:hypothetical protein